MAEKAFNGAAHGYPKTYGSWELLSYEQEVQIRTLEETGGDTISKSCISFKKYFKLDLRISMIVDEDNCTTKGHSKDVPHVKMPIIQIAAFNGKLSMQIQSGGLIEMSIINDMNDNLRKLFNDHSTEEENSLDVVLNDEDVEDNNNDDNDVEE
ncbi:hypothetical protein BD770DRAFT_444024 [Pilaira anomala]|nr:hypothetical protein BD770DRAFT_444024 [Pilaira anomala]